MCCSCREDEVRYSDAKGVVVGLSAPVPAQRLLFSQPYRRDTVDSGFMPCQHGI